MNDSAYVTIDFKSVFENKSCCRSIILDQDRGFDGTWATVLQEVAYVMNNLEANHRWWIDLNILHKHLNNAAREISMTYLKDIEEEDGSEK